MLFEIVRGGRRRDQHVLPSHPTRGWLSTSMMFYADSLLYSGVSWSVWLYLMQLCLYQLPYCIIMCWNHSYLNGWQRTSLDSDLLFQGLKACGQLINMHRTCWSRLCSPRTISNSIQPLKWPLAICRLAKVRLGLISVCCLELRGVRFSEVRNVLVLW